tara:strand:+ start:1535 stop:1804 length:270 start_codon:yes stop_codon:yes gene_type:complete
MSTTKAAPIGIILLIFGGLLSVAAGIGIFAILQSRALEDPEERSRYLEALALPTGISTVVALTLIIFGIKWLQQPALSKADDLDKPRSR